MKHRKLLPRLVALLLAALLLAGCAGKAPAGNNAEAPAAAPAGEAGAAADLSERPAFVSLANFAYAADAPSTTPYAVNADFSNVVNWDRYWFSDEQAGMLRDNLFFVHKGYNKEFFNLYESNRYNMLANFVTVDSMMHTYHLYFAYLMKNTERDYLSPMLEQLSGTMLTQAQALYERLRGSEWENAAARVLTFFAVGAKLMDEYVEIPASVLESVNTELSRIEAAEGIAVSTVTGEFEDYSQYRVRGYYESTPALHRYFKAMMWYGRVNFPQKSEELDRAALLATLAIDSDAEELWREIYTVTAFFAGTSDDYGFYEYRPLIRQAYGELSDVGAIIGDEAGWQRFHALTAALAPPRINSVPTRDEGAGADKAAENKGFRFMGQRFTLDEAIFSRLTYSKVGENPAGDKRMLPSTLDVAAALGSNLAYILLNDMGATAYAGYPEAMMSLREDTTLGSDTGWKASLYAGWLETLRPLLEEKGEGWPSFMQSTLWQTHSLETYAGSFTELKHDTILYAKQMMAEMGGAEIPQSDDRGYVEPEPAVYAALCSLVGQTSAGLDRFRMLSDADRENLSRLQELASRLQTIAEKELREELPTDEEFELIRTYGGTLEHFWEETLRGEENPGGFLDAAFFPAALVADIATDPNGSVLEVGTGNPAVIYVICPVDGVLRVCSGTVFDFYEFSWPMSDRLTDTRWRQLMGIEIGESGMYSFDSPIDKPAWTLGYRDQ